MKLFALGSSIVSSYWNGAATYYRGIYRALAAKGHEITFAEPDSYGRQQHRDEGDFSYVRSLVYQPGNDLPQVMKEAARADLVIKHSGVGADDARLEDAVSRLDRPRAFWDVDAPATLARVRSDASDAFRYAIPRFDFIFTYGGGQRVIDDYLALGARNCHPIYNALDPDQHFPVEPQPEFAYDLAFVGNRLPDREQRVEDFFFRCAELCPQMTFLLGGEGWGSKKLPPNVRWIGHVATAQHNAINCSARMVLNINRDSMAEVGFSPPTRVFEAAGAGACLVTDKWNGIEAFFAPGKEILVVDSAEALRDVLTNNSADKAKQIGNAMRERALRDHTYVQRGSEVDAILQRMPRATCAR